MAEGAASGRRRGNQKKGLRLNEKYWFAMTKAYTEMWYDRLEHHKSCKQYSNLKINNTFTLVLSLSPSPSLSLLIGPLQYCRKIIKA